jgi:hypothetical protein
MRAGKESGKEKGQALLLVVVAMSLFLIAALGLVMDGAQIYGHRQMAQDAADAAAQAGIMSIFTGTNVTGGSPFGTGTNPGPHTCTTTDPITPCVYARNNQFGGTAADTIVISYPKTAPGVNLATSPDPANTANIIQVNITRTLNTGIMKMLGSATSTVTAVAVAAVVDVVNPVPILVLHPNLSGAFMINGTPTITICGGPTRSIQVNSISTTSIITKGGSNTVDLSRAGPLDSGTCNTGTGADFGDFGGPVNYPSTLLTGVGQYVQPASPIDDPLLSVAAPAVPGTAGTQTTITVAAVTRYGCPAGQQCTLYTPGLYASGIDVKNDWALFTPGIYYISGGGFNLESNSAATMATGTGAPPAGFTNGPGMLVYNTGSAAGDVFNFTSNAGSKGPVTLIGSDDTSAYKGILFFQDRGSVKHVDNKGHLLQGGGTISLTGTIYVTNTVATMKGDATHYQTLQLQGNPGSTTTIIGEIITDNLQLGGTAGIKMNLNPNSNLHIRQVALVR